MFCVTLGVLEKVDDGVDDEADPRENVTLGRGSIKCAFTGDKMKLEAFLREARAAAVAPPRARASTPGQSTPDDNAAQHGEYADKVRAALRTIGKTTNTLMTKTVSRKANSKSGYYLDFLVRKLYLASLAVTKRACDSTCSLGRLREYSADAKEHLKQLPEEWTAAEASAYVCGRPDWAVFVSMYMCLWKEVADAAEEMGDAKGVLRWVLKNKKELVAHATIFRAKHGLNPHPWILMREAGWAGARAKTPSRKRMLPA